LTGDGISTFLDVECIGPGYYPKILKENVKNTPTLVVIVSPGSFDDRNCKKDYYFKEIYCALKEKKRVIPVLADKFDFGTEHHIPERLLKLKSMQAVLHIHEYHNAAIEKLVHLIKENDKAPAGNSYKHSNYTTPSANYTHPALPSEKVEIWKWRFYDLPRRKQIHILTHFSTNQKNTPQTVLASFDQLLSTTKTEHDFAEIVKFIEENE